MHVALGGEHVQYTCAVAHKVVIVVGQSFHHGTATHVILLGGSCSALFGVNHNRLVVGHNHPAAMPLETGGYHFDVVHIGSYGYAAQFTSVLIKGVNQPGVGKCQHLLAYLYATAEEDALGNGACLALCVDDGDAR